MTVSKEFLNPSSLPSLPGFSQVVTTSAGKMVFISGQVALNQKGEVVGKGNLEEQTTQVFENLKSALAAAGATFTDVVKVNYYVVQLKQEQTAIIRAVRSKYLPKENPPASTLVGVHSLVLDDLLIEIEAVVVL